MPSLADIPSPVHISSKKRQRDSQDDPYIGISSSYNPHRFRPESSTQFLEPAARKVLPLPAAKRFRPQEQEEAHDQHNPSNSHSAFGRKPAHSPSLFTPSHKDHHEASYFASAHSDHTTTPTSPQNHPQIPVVSPRPLTSRANSSLLSPCHICHRKPTRKTDLDCYADCHGCGQRACFVCIRQCQGWLTPQTHPGSRFRPGSRDQGKETGRNMSGSFTMCDIDDENADGEQHPQQPSASSGPFSNTQPGEASSDAGWQGCGHRSVICSRCCVERGTEGEVMCLGCLADVEGA